MADGGAVENFGDELPLRTLTCFPKYSKTASRAQVVRAEGDHTQLGHADYLSGSRSGPGIGRYVAELVSR